MNTALSCTVNMLFCKEPLPFTRLHSRVYRTIKNIMGISVFYVSLNFEKNAVHFTPQSVGLLSDSKARVSFWHYFCLPAVLATAQKTTIFKQITSAMSEKWSFHRSTTPNPTDRKSVV